LGDILLEVQFSGLFQLRIGQVEDVWIVQTQLKVVAGLMNGEVQFRPIELADFHEIPFTHEPNRLEYVFLLVDTQFGGQHAPVKGNHFRIDLKTDDIGKFASRKVDSIMTSKSLACSSERSVMALR
jgi:hypothetical protein